MVPGYNRRDDSVDDDAPNEPKCRRCGSTNVRWRQQGGKWVLFSLEPGKLHVCPIIDNFKPVLE